MNVDIHQHRILILDFGSQYTQLIARRVREIGVYCEILPFDVGDEAITNFNAKGIILTGGPETVTMETTPRVPASVFQLNLPVLGICYGLQAMAHQLGGAVAAGGKREYGHVQVTISKKSKLFQGIEDRIDSKGLAQLDVWMSHGDKVDSLPDGFEALAYSDNSPLAAIGDETRQLYGLQFHPEVTHTKQGKRILERFILDICQCQALWTSSNIIEDSIKHVRELVGSDQVILGLSGGVDSSVVAALLHQAIGDQLTCVFVDTGLLRLNEAEEVMSTFTKQMDIEVDLVNAQQRFMQALQGVSDPERKRKIIGREFIAVFEQEAAKFSNARWLAQGTIYPDVIESAASKTGKAHVIKSHHNVGGLPEDMKLKLVEPLRELFKDEVRQLGVELGLPYDRVYRHPFPGPGLGVRILGEVSLGYADMLRRADDIFIRALYQHKLYDKVSQAFAVFLPVKSVGVMGDARKYDYVIALRAVETTDFMTAHWARLPYDFLDQVSHQIINEIPGISRVVYDISGKPPATIEWE